MLITPALFISMDTSNLLSLHARISHSAPLLSCDFCERFLVVFQREHLAEVRDYDVRFRTGHSRDQPLFSFDETLLVARNEQDAEAVLRELFAEGESDAGVSAGDERPRTLAVALGQVVTLALGVLVGPAREAHDAQGKCKRTNKEANREEVHLHFKNCQLTLKLAL